MVANRDEWVEGYLNAIEKEISAVNVGMPAPQEVDTVFLGGGTPSHLSADQLERLIYILTNKFLFASEIEFSIEANPNDITAEKVELLSSLGVNRFSLGVAIL